jgi:hypothetical protein
VKLHVTVESQGLAMGVRSLTSVRSMCTARRGMPRSGENPNVRLLEHQRLESHASERLEALYRSSSRGHLSLPTRAHARRHWAWWQSLVASGNDPLLAQAGS